MILIKFHTGSNLSVSCIVLFVRARKISDVAWNHDCVQDLRTRRRTGRRLSQHLRHDNCKTRAV